MYSFGQKILDIVSREYDLQLTNIDSWLGNPPKQELGDFAFSCFGISKEKKLNPTEIATRLASLFNLEKDYFYQASSMGGYVNFKLSNRIFIEDISRIDFNPKQPKNETVIVDYIGPNVGKPLHIGHLCTPLQGQSVINVCRDLGYKVISDSHFGDWGGIFGKIIYARNNLIDDIGYQPYRTELDILQQTKGLHFKQWSKEDQDNWKEEKLKIDGVNLLLRLYGKFHVRPISNWEEIEKSRDEGARKEFQYLSGVGIDLSNSEELKHHEENVELWKKFTAISIEGIERQMDLLNIHVDYNIGESFYEGLNLPRPNNEDYPDLEYTMQDIVKELLDKKIATKNEDGSVGVIFPEETKMPSCVLQKKDGTGLYLTSDLACIKYRLTNGWNPSKILYFVSVEQQLHLKQAFWIAKQAWGNEFPKVDFVHAQNGYVRLKSGKMSTRSGNFITLQELIDEGFNLTKNILETKGKKDLSDENIRAIAIGAIKYSYLGQDREKDVVFDWDKALSFEGNSGPYVQYAYVRAKKVTRHSELVSESMDAEINSAGRIISLEGLDFNKIELSQNDKSLAKKLLEFEGKVQEAANKYKPHIIAQYCYELASEFNSFYVNTPKILEEKDENLKNLRLKLIELTRDILKKGFELLAINMPEEM